jgi:hypothetical protein
VVVFCTLEGKFEDPQDEVHRVREGRFFEWEAVENGKE